MLTPVAAATSPIFIRERYLTLDSGPGFMFVGMILLHIPANVSAPIACDMTDASDTPDERIAEYGRLFGRAFAERQRDGLSVTLNFHNKPGVAEWAQDLAHREAACCPFVDYRIERYGDRISWTITGADDPTVQAILNGFYDLPEMFDTGI